MHFLITLLLALITAGAAQAQGKAPASAWNRIETLMQEGCVQQQMQQPGAGSARGSVVESACSCMARRTVGRLRESPEFKQALREQNKEAFPELLAKLQRDDDGKHVLAACTEEASKDAKPPAAAAAPAAKPSSKHGLKGTERDLFVTESSKTCNLAFREHVQEGRMTSEQLSSFCGCMAGGMADRVSQEEIEQGLKSGGRTAALDAAARDVQRSCSLKHVHS